MDLSLMEMWNHMSLFVKFLAFILIGMSILSLSIAVAKLHRFRTMSRATRAFAPQFSAALEANNIPEALALTEQYQKSHVARVLGESLREVAPLLDNPNTAGAAITSAERSVEREQILLANELKSGLGLLATVGSTAPFVGLLGTTIGIINAFQGMATQGGGLEAVSGGISEALIKTALGLIVAIPAVWLYNYFSGRLDTIFSELAYAGREMIDWMMTREANRNIASAARSAGTKV